MTPNAQHSTSSHLPSKLKTVLTLQSRCIAFSLLYNLPPLTRICTGAAPASPSRERPNAIVRPGQPCSRAMPPARAPSTHAIANGDPFLQVRCRRLVRWSLTLRSSRRKCFDPRSCR